MTPFEEFVKAIADAWLMLSDIPAEDLPDETTHLMWKLEQFADRHMPGYLDGRVEELVRRNQAATLFDEVPA